MPVPNIFANQSGPIPLSELDSNFAAVPTSAVLAASTGSTLVGTTNGGTGSVTRTVASKLNDTVSVKDFGAVGNGITNDTAAIQAAMDSGAFVINFPAGIYKISAAININAAMIINGSGTTATQIVTYNATANMFNINTAYSVEFNDLELVTAVTQKVQTAGVFVSGVSYTIQSIGSTDFTLIGASANTVGVVFTASGIGAGTGTASPNNGGNIGLGYSSGSGITTGSNNVVLGGYNGGAAPISATGSNYVVLSDGAGNVRQTIDPNGHAIFGATTRTAGYLVAALPTGVTGMRAYVTNALTPVFGATVVTGGAVTVPVFYNGTNWIVG